MIKQTMQRLAGLAGYEIRKKGGWPQPQPQPIIPSINHWEATAYRSAEEIAALKARVDRYAENVGWFHSFDFGHGVRAHGPAALESLSKRVNSLGLTNLVGKSFLDIASWDGFYAFEAERRGAKRVLATDKFCWGGAGWGSKDGFLLAREILNSKVEDREIEVHDLSPETVGMFDVVLFSGIFYHMRDPISAMMAAASVAKERLIVETHVYNEQHAAPLMQYIPRDPKLPKNHGSNYWRPNSAMIAQLLKEMGFPRVDIRVETDPPGGHDSSHGFFDAYR